MDLQRRTCFPIIIVQVQQPQLQNWARQYKRQTESVVPAFQKNSGSYEPLNIDQNIISRLVAQGIEDGVDGQIALSSHILEQSCVGVYLKHQLIGMLLHLFDQDLPLALELLHRQEEVELNQRFTTKKFNSSREMLGTGVADQLVMSRMFHQLQNGLDFFSGETCCIKYKSAGGEFDLVANANVILTFMKMLDYVGYKIDQRSALQRFQFQRNEPVAQGEYLSQSVQQLLSHISFKDYTASQIVKLPHSQNLLLFAVDGYLLSPLAVQREMFGKWEGISELFLKNCLDFGLNQQSSGPYFDELNDGMIVGLLYMQTEVQISFRKSEVYPRDKGVDPVENKWLCELYLFCCK